MFNKKVLCQEFILCATVNIPGTEKPTEQGQQGSYFTKRHLGCLLLILFWSSLSLRHMFPRCVQRQFSFVFVGIRVDFSQENQEICHFWVHCECFDTEQEELEKLFFMHFGFSVAYKHGGTYEKTSSDGEKVKESYSLTFNYNGHNVAIL